MLPEVRLRDVTREDVARVARWLEDEEVSSGWLSHDACGEPAHRGYDPGYMLESPEGEWDQVFLYDPYRIIFSIDDGKDEHIGECQLVFDDRGSAGLSLLIGRKDLWHQGYGTSTVSLLLDRVFNYFKLDRVWVNIPEDNTPALGLFMKLGFVHEAARKLCTLPGGAAVRTHILGMNAGGHKATSLPPHQARRCPLSFHQALSEADIFRELTGEQIDRVEWLGQPLQIPAGQVLGKAGELTGRLFIIVQGKAVLSAHFADSEITVRVAGPGESFPVAALVGSGTLITSAEAMTDMKLLAIPRTPLLGLFAELPEIGMKVYAAIAEVLANRYSRTLEQMMSGTVAVI